MRERSWKGYALAAGCRLPVELDLGTYNCPDKLRLIDAEWNAGQAVEPESETQSCWAMATGVETARTARRRRKFFIVWRGCCWRWEGVSERQQLSKGRESQRRHWRILYSLRRRKGNMSCRDG